MAGRTTADTKEIVKTALRIKTDAFDDEIKHLIIACANDLRMSGVRLGGSDDPGSCQGASNQWLGSLAVQAYILYAKANFGFSSDSEKYRQAYEQLKGNMSLSSGFNTTFEYLRHRKSIEEQIQAAMQEES